MTERSIASEEKRRLLLDAAVRVFARKGYHSARVGDIAEEAGVAHGLLYHYFASKQEVLETVFRETWAELLEAIERVAEAEEPAPTRLRHVAAIFLRSWRRDPDLVRVLVREVGRSQTLPPHVEEVRRVFEAIQGLIERGQADGELRGDVDPRLACWILYGAIEQVLTGWTLGRHGVDDDEVLAAERAVTAIVVGGLSLASGTAAARR